MTSTAVPTVGLSLPGHYLWDPWPVHDRLGAVLRVGERELWVALVCPESDDPESRHDRARQHLLLVGTDIEDLGPLFPDGASPGSREWSGCTVYDPVSDLLTAYYTAAGTRGEPIPAFSQHVMAAQGTLTLSDGRVTTNWGKHQELVRPNAPYLPSGFTTSDRWLNAFRDPGWFLDPHDGSEHLLIAASVGSDGACADNGPWGAVALASRTEGGWSLRAPLLTTIGTNRELERPHILVRKGLYYLFVSTQRHVFAPESAGPTGLYGYVADTLTGPYAPLNGDGLVLANPADRPHEAYAWLVTGDLRVVGFLNYPDEPAGEDRPGPTARFAGGFAPTLRLDLAADTATARPDPIAGVGTRKEREA